MNPHAQSPMLGGRFPPTLKGSKVNGAGLYGEDPGIDFSDTNYFPALTAGDRLLVWLLAYAGEITAPAGWTTLAYKRDVSGISGMSAGLYTKISAGNEGVITPNPVTIYGRLIVGMQYEACDVEASGIEQRSPSGGNKRADCQQINENVRAAEIVLCTGSSMLIESGGPEANLTIPNGFTSLAFSGFGSGYGTCTWLGRKTGFSGEPPSVNVVYNENGRTSGMQFAVFKE
jgi:hypothetical protein